MELLAPLVALLTQGGQVAEVLTQLLVVEVVLVLQDKATMEL